MFPAEENNAVTLQSIKRGSLNFEVGPWPPILLSKLKTLKLEVR